MILMILNIYPNIILGMNISRYLFFYFDQFFLSPFLSFLSVFFFLCFYISTQKRLILVKWMLEIWHERVSEVYGKYFHSDCLSITFEVWVWFFPRVGYMLISHIECWIITSNDQYYFWFLILSRSCYLEMHNY